MQISSPGKCGKMLTNNNRKNFILILYSIKISTANKNLFVRLIIAQKSQAGLIFGILF